MDWRQFKKTYTEMMPRHKTPRTLLDASRRLRQEETPAEAELWDILRNRRADGARFKRQVVIGNYIADFYCPKHRLIIELDGRVHHLPDVRLNDQIRQANLETEGYIVMRFTNDQVELDIRGVVQVIVDFLETVDPSEPL